MVNDDLGKLAAFTTFKTDQSNSIRLCELGTWWFLRLFRGRTHWRPQRKGCLSSPHSALWRGGKCSRHALPAAEPSKGEIKDAEASIAKTIQNMRKHYDELFPQQISLDSTHLSSGCFWNHARMAFKSRSASHFSKPSLGT